ncbi:MAG: hypothetical protein IJ282_00810 [Lachnospiraceae bacterium]|nr:hypothetical protein [Lachnospiraceae bacterium]
MKRKIILGLVSIVLCVSMVGCGATSTDAPSSSSGSAFATETPTETPTDAPTDAPTEAPQEHVNTETNDKESKEDEEESSVITFDEMLDSMVAEYGEVEFIPVFAERNFEDTITHLETQLRPTEYTVTKVYVNGGGELSSVVTNSGEYFYGNIPGRYVPITYDGEKYYVTYPEVYVYPSEPFDLQYTPGVPTETETYYRYVDNAATVKFVYPSKDGVWYGWDFHTYSYEFGENVHHFMYEGESYVFLYETVDMTGFGGITDACRGIVLKDTEYTKGKTVDISGLAPY